VIATMNSKLQLSNCLVTRQEKTQDNTDQYVLFNDNMLGPLKLDKSTWVWVLHNIQLAHIQTKILPNQPFPPSGEIGRSVNLGQGSQYLLKQLVKKENETANVYLRIEMVSFNMWGKPEHRIIDLPFSPKDHDDMVQFIKDWTVAPYKKRKVDSD
jgi:hypothetical protein